MARMAGNTSEVRTAPRNGNRAIPSRSSVLVVGLAAGLAAAVGGPEPVGDNWLSTMIVTAVVASVCWIGSSAPRLFLSWMVLIAGVSTLWLPALVIAGAVFTLVQFGERSVPLLDERSPHAATVSAALAGLAMVLASHSDLAGFLGASTVVGVTIGLLIAVTGLARSEGRVRRIAGLVALTAIIGAVLATVAFAGLSLTVADEFSDAEKSVRDGMKQLGDADLSGATASFRQASQQFERADDRLGSPLGAVAAAVPVVAQHRSAAIVLTQQAAETTGHVAELLDGFDVDALSLVDSRIDLQGVAAFGVAIEDIQVTLQSLDDEIERVSSPWLLRPATEQLDDLRAEIGEQRARAEMASKVTEALPAMLGGDGERAYLLLFTTPAEARGLGGFTGNWAEITADDGRITVSDLGRSDELDDAAPPGTRTVSGPTEWLERYGEFGFTNSVAGTVGADPFKNITMSPLMSSTGQVVAELYPQSGGREIDGVFAANVYVLAELLRLTGPIDVTGANRPIDAKNAAEFLLNKQYAIPNKDERIDSIAEASDLVVERLLAGGAEVTPRRLLRALGPMAEQGRLAGWATESAEQDLLVEIGLAGTMQPFAADDGVTMAFNNAAGNKIDYFLEASGRYEARVKADGTVEGIFEVTLENTAPATGQPRYVIANAIDAPAGTNQTLLSLYTALPAADLTVDGVAVPGYSGAEAGYFVTDALLYIPPGESRTVRLRVSGQVDVSDGYSLLVRSPPAVGSTPIGVDLTLVDETGERTISETLETAGLRLVDIELTPLGAP